MQEGFMIRVSGRVILMLCLSMATLAHARAARAEECKRVRAEINLSTGTIEGNLGLDGTVAFVEDSSGEPPATAPAGSSVFSGILTITTDRGVLSMRETGMFSGRTGNPAGPVLSSWGDSPSGTGRYADVVAGDLFFAGRQVGDQFLVDVSGELCRQ
jgi:hypothetical protein